MEVMQVDPVVDQVGQRGAPCLVGLDVSQGEL